MSEEQRDDKKCAVHPDAAWPFPTKPRSVAPSAELARSDRHATWNAAMERAAEICDANLADDPIGKFGVAECAKDIRASKLPLPTPRPGMKFPEREMQSATAPLEVTSEMEEAGMREAQFQYNLPVTRASVYAIFKAMLNAADRSTPNG